MFRARHIRLVFGDFTADIEHTARVGADDFDCFAGFERRDFITDHRAGNIRVLHRECTAEAATFAFMIVHHARDMAQLIHQRPARFMHIHFAAGGAAGVHGDLRRCADIIRAIVQLVP